MYVIGGFGYSTVILNLNQNSKPLNVTSKFKGYGNITNTVPHNLCMRNESKMENKCFIKL